MANSEFQTREDKRSLALQPSLNMTAVMQGDKQTNYFKYDPNKYGDNENTRIVEKNHKRISKK